MMFVTTQSPDDEKIPAEGEPQAPLDSSEKKKKPSTKKTSTKKPMTPAAKEEGAAKSLADSIEADGPHEANASEGPDEFDESIEAAVEAIAYHPVFETIEEAVASGKDASGGKGKKSKKKVTPRDALRTFFLSRGFSRGLGVVGESLITLGVVVMLFLGWQLWINDVIIFNESTVVAEENVKKWTTSTTPAPSSTDAAGTDYGPAPVMSKAEMGGVFGNIYIPRFGNDYIKVAAEGVDAENTLNRGYFGRYPDSQLPGESGNLAFAVHRAGHGSPFRQAATLRLGDTIVLQTSNGYYSYVLRNTEYVMPSQVSVVSSIPGGGAPVVGQSLLTITTCNPELGNNERLILYAVFVGWQPADAGPPKEIASMVKA